MKSSSKTRKKNLSIPAKKVVEFKIHRLALVTLAGNNNPTILNQDFLKDNKIVPSEWTLENPPISTPVIAQVTFKERIAIVAEFEKLQFIENKSERIPGGSPVIGIADKYINILPYVQYKALGINFFASSFFNNKESIREFLINKFIAVGIWKTYGDSPVDIGLKFIIKVGEFRCTVSLEQAELQLAKSGKKKPILAVNANYHLDGEESDKEHKWLHQGIRKWRNQYNHFNKMLNDFFT